MTRLELVAVIVLSITAVLTAWSGFEASKWGGEMSISFSRASTARIEAARHAGQANALRQFDLTIFATYVEAVGGGDDEVAAVVGERFPDHFAVAFDEWVTMDPLGTPDAPRSPFALDSYVVPGEAESADADARADALFQAALDNNQRGDTYTLLTVLVALVHFFAAVSGRLDSKRLAWGVLGGAVRPAQRRRRVPRGVPQDHLTAARRTGASSDHPWQPRWLPRRVVRGPWSARGPL